MAEWRTPEALEKAKVYLKKKGYLKILTLPQFQWDLPEIRQYSQKCKYFLEKCKYNLELYWAIWGYETQRDRGH